MNAAIYYTLTQHAPNHILAFSGTDRTRLNVLLEQLHADGHRLRGIYITDSSVCPYQSQHQLLRRDACLHRFDLLYLYLYGSPASITAEELSDILDLPVNGRTAMFDQKLIRLAEMLAPEKAAIR